MIKNSNKFIKATKIILIICSVFVIQKVNMVNLNDKITNENLNKTIDLTAMAYKLNEIQLKDKYYPLDTFTGDLTGYTADCPLCSGRLACTPNYNVLNGTETYPDASYGNVRIVASSKNLPCGTVIRFNKANVSNNPIIAIVLDRGVIGNDIDLLSNSNDYAVKTIGRSSISYDILRTGW